MVGIVIAALIATGFGLGGRAIGLFDEHGKRIPLSSLSPRDRETLVYSLCRRLAFSHARGAPQEVCLDGEPTIEEIANDGSEMHWRVRYPWGVTCIASGRVGGYRGLIGEHFMIGQFGCNVGAPKEKLVPTPLRPITVDASMTASRDHPRALLLRVTGLAGAGVASVGLVPRQGSILTTAVRGHAYSFTSIPDREWIAVAAFDNSGKEIYRDKRALPLRAVLPAHSSVQSGHVSFPEPPPRPTEPPLQHASSSTASVDVYRNGVVALRFSSTQSDAYRTLARSARHSSGGVGIDCRTLAYGAGRWKNLGGGWSVRLAPEIRMKMQTQYGGMPSPPFDLCEISGTYGRYWNDEEGTHELVEVPFTRLARRYLDERATARDLAYFVRTRKMWRIRKAVFHGESTPSAVEIAREFGERVVPLTARDGTPPSGRIGVWTDGRLIVAVELTSGGRRLFVTVRAVRIGANNIRDLSFTF